MKKIIRKNVGVISFYFLVVLAVLVLNARFNYINNIEKANNNTISESELAYNN